MGREGFPCISHENCSNRRENHLKYRRIKKRISRGSWMTHNSNKSKDVVKKRASE